MGHQTQGGRVWFGFRRLDGNFFDSLSELSQLLSNGTTLLAQVLDDEADRAAVAAQIAEADARANEITSGIIRELNQTFATPLDREDIYTLATELSRVMERIDQAVDLIVLYQVDKLPKQFARQVDLVQRCAELTAEAMARLPERSELADYWTEVGRLEANGDKQFRRILAKLYDGRYEPFDALKLRDIISAMESAIDGFARVANTVEQIVVKES